MRLLVIEDNQDLADTIRMGLSELGYEVELASDGPSGERKAREQTFDALVVDWMLPRKSGPDVIAALREDGILTPVLMLTSRAENADLVAALEVGADDYLSKPFAFAVLSARLGALIRRGNSAQNEPSFVRIGALTLDPEQRRAYQTDVDLCVRDKEFGVLLTLGRSAGRFVERTTLADRVWHDAFVSDDVINTTVASLRRKLRHGACDVQIETARGVGYRLRDVKVDQASSAGT
jgi:DNA-binding response OmpR family regulator